jgi:hypothetical protein
MSDLKENRSRKPYPQPVNYPIGERLYKLYLPFVYIWKKNDTWYRITIPEGLEYDGASIPRWAWSVLGLRPDGLIRAAATGHDFLYVNGGKIGQNYERLDGNLWKEVNATWTKEQTDRLFGRMLREAGIPAFRRKLAFKAVSWFGKGAF